jgi:hypothetical protein
MLNFEAKLITVLKLGHFGRQTRKTLKVVKCVAEER